MGFGLLLCAATWFYYGVDLVNSVVIRRCTVAVYVILLVNCVAMFFGCLICSFDGVLRLVYAVIVLILLLGLFAGW